MLYLFYNHIKMSGDMILIDCFYLNELLNVITNYALRYCEVLIRRSYSDCRETL